MPDLSEQKENVRRVLLRALDSQPLSQYGEDLPSAENCFSLLQQRGHEYVTELVAQLGAADPTDLARCVLVRAACAALDEVGGLQISHSVKRLFLQHFNDYAEPPDRWRGMFDPAGVRYREMVKIVALQRFPAGQQDWVVSYFPRSWIRDAGPVNGLRLMAALLGTGGRGPMWEVHLNDRRPAPFLMRERDGHESYFRIAKSMECQPDVKGLMCRSWFYSEELARVSPHLSWLRATFKENGAILAGAGAAPADSGFLVGDLKRKELYEREEFRPVLTVVLWPRSAMLEWARRHPEFDKP